MTTKTVAVQLVALTSQYQKSMGAATASTAKLSTTAGATSKSIGSIMGPTIALGAAVAAGAAVKLGLDWENAFTRITAITDSSQAQIETWKSQVMDLAGETARAPAELAEALYFLASAGLDANEVMPALEASAKAAAVGLGETADIARLTANAMNAYQASGLKAAEVTDILVAAVREGTAEPDEFADAMGRILPIAAKAGISFDQVAASLATVSNAGLDVDEGVTAMRGVLISLLAPGKQAADTLRSIGLTADEVRRSLAGDGLIATLRLLETRTGGNIDMLRKIIPNVRAMAGAFNLTGQDMKKVDAIFADVMNSSGDAGEAFKKTAETDVHKLRQAFVDLQVAGTELGVALIPIMTSLATALGEVGKAFASIPEWAVLSAHSLALQIDPNVAYVDSWNQIREALMSGKLSHEDAMAAVDALGASGFVTADKIADLRDMVIREGSAMQEGSSEADRYGGAMEDAGDAAGNAEGGVDKFGKAVGKTATELEKAEKAADGFADALAELTKVAFDVEEARLNWHTGLIELRGELKDGAKVLDLNSQAGLDNREALKGQLENAMDLGVAMRENGASVNEATRATMAHVREVRNLAIAAGFTEEEVDAYIRTLNLTPKQIRTLLQVDKKKAEQDLESYWQKLFRLNGMSVTTYVNQVTTTEGREGGSSGGSKIEPKFHRGGIVGLKPDEVSIIAKKGEYVLTAAQYQALTSAKHMAGVPSRQASGPQVRVAFRLDRRRFTDELDHDAAYAGHW